MHRAAAGIPLLFSACLVAGCASGASVGTVQRRTNAKVVRVARRASLPRTLSMLCPSHAVRATSLEVAGPPMVPSGAVRLRLCRYSGANAPRPLRLARSRLIRNVSLIDRLTHELNTLPPARGTYHCPLDDGSEIVLRFGYRARTPRQVVVGLTGCQFITNLWTDTSGPSPQSARLVRQLTALTSR
jgi:hypothetical protein